MSDFIPCLLVPIYDGVCGRGFGDRVEGLSHTGIEHGHRGHRLIWIGECRGY